MLTMQSCRQWDCRRSPLRFARRSVSCAHPAVPPTVHLTLGGYIVLLDGWDQFCDDALGAPTRGFSVLCRALMLYGFWTFYCLKNELWIPIFQRLLGIVCLNDYSSLFYARVCNKPISNKEVNTINTHISSKGDKNGVVLILKLRSHIHSSVKNNKCGQ